MSKWGFIEIFLLEFVIYILLWLVNDYLAMMLSLTFCVICFFILLISLVAELIERSRVPRWYFTLMIASILAPILSAVIYLSITGGLENWLDGLQF